MDEYSAVKVFLCGNDDEANNAGDAFFLLRHVCFVKERQEVEARFEYCLVLGTFLAAAGMKACILFDADPNTTACIIDNTSNLLLLWCLYQVRKSHFPAGEHYLGFSVW